MKILMINSVCGIRSTGRICTDIAEELEKQGHDVKIAYGRETVPEKYQKYAVRIGTDLDVKLHGIKTRLFDRHGFGSKRATKKFIKWVEEYDPDVIHLHNLHGYYINIKILFDYLKKANKKVVWTLHDCWAFTGHCTYFDYSKCEKWKLQCKKCPSKKDYPCSVALDSSCRNYGIKKKIFTGLYDMTIVTPSEWLKGLVQQSFISEYKVVCIHNGIDLNVFQSAQSNFKQTFNIENKKIVLAVSSIWERRKGLSDVIELAQLLPNEYQVVIVGVDEIQKEQLPANIIGITRTNNAKELAEIYSAADVFVNLTYEDNYPTVNLEALACGTPVITYKTGGSVESVDVHNQVEQGDVAAVARKIVNGEYEKNINRNLYCSKEDFAKECVKIYE